MKTILITGATGFLGTHLVDQLGREEPETKLRLLCRSGRPGALSSPIEVVPGDITSAQDVLEAAAGVSEVYHLAGVVQRDPKDPALLNRVHVEGTRNVCEAIREQGVSKAVLVSSSGTVAVGRTPEVRDEESGYAVDAVGEWPYYTSKIYAEKLALRYFEQERLPIVIVNPSLLLGPGDDRESSTGDVALFLDGQIMAVPSGGLNLVDARDAAAGLIAAMKRGRPGERYILGGPNWTFREWIARTAQLSGLKAPSLQPPLWAALWSGRILRRVLPLAGKSFKLDDASIKMSAMFWYCDSSKAKRELGFETRDPMITLRETIEDIRRRRSCQSPERK
jgi:dihydroflavonol-4-reductase